MTSIRVDASDYAMLARGLSKIPAQMRSTVLVRAHRRAGEAARTAVIRQAARDSGMRVGDVRSKTSGLTVSAEGARFTMRSGWWKLIDLGSARQTRIGVTVRNWGPHRGAFLVGRYGGIFRREGQARGPIHELYGPNPVSYVVDRPGAYEDLLGRHFGDVAARRVLHELDRLLARVG